ncbi:MAG: hypothetical protein RI601_08995, partial [Desulfurivibrionaceae bacterium]|nr:hypothetical protein [Desulfurivibrionaceae bacterium]
MKKIPLLFALLLLFSLAGCAGRINLDQARQAGARQLSADNINTLVAGNSLHMVSWSKADEADIDFSEKGTLNAINSLGEKTHGRWTTDRDQNTLCLKFKFWGDGATNCFRVFKDEEHYLLFNNDGTLAHTFVPEYEVEYTLADLNAGVLAQPPSQDRRLPRQTATQETAAAAPAANGGLLSTLTFGVLGAGDNGEAEEVDHPEFAATT